MVANKNQSPESVVEAKPPKVFRKENILRFKRYAGRRDLLSVLLDAEQEYTLEQVDTLMDNTVKKQKCPDFSIGATQKDSHSEPKISIFPPNLRVRRTCTSAYKWVDALEVDAGMPQNQFEYNMDIRKKQVLRQLFSYLFVPGAAPAWCFL